MENNKLNYASWVKNQDNDIKVLRRKCSGEESSLEFITKFDTIGGFFDYYSDIHMKLPFIGTKNNKTNNYEFSSFGDIKTKVNIISSYISTCLDHISTIGIISKNREEYIVFQLSILKSYKILVPIYFDIDEEFLINILNETKLEVIILEYTSKNLTKIINIINESSNDQMKNCELKYVILLENTESEEVEIQKLELLHKLKSLEKIKLNVIHYKEMFIKYIKENIKEDNKEDNKDNNSTNGIHKKQTIASINYKFGRKSLQKPIVLSHKALLSSIESLIIYLEHLNLSENDSYYSYMPISNTSEITLIYALAYFGVNTSFCTCIFQNIIEDVKVIKPTIFFGVSRIINKLSCLVRNIIDI